MKFECVDREYSDEWLEVVASSAEEAAKIYCRDKRSKDFEYEGGVIEVKAMVPVILVRNVSEQFLATECA